MQVRVELFLHFRRYAGPSGAAGPLLLDLPEGASSADLLAALGIPSDADKVVLVDGRLHPLEAPLAPGQTVTVFPPLEGG